MVAAEASLETARRQIEDLRSRLDHALNETAKVRESSQRAMTEAVERFGAAERRAALEIDRERMARAGAEKHVEAIRRQFEAAVTEARQAETRQLQSAAQADAQISQLKETAIQAASREEDLRAQLRVMTNELADSQREAHTARAEATMAERLATAMRQAPRRRQARPQNSVGTDNGR